MPEHMSFNPEMPRKAENEEEIPWAEEIAPAIETEEDPLEKFLRETKSGNQDAQSTERRGGRGTSGTTDEIQPEDLAA